MWLYTTQISISVFFREEINTEISNVVLPFARGDHLNISASETLASETFNQLVRIVNGRERGCTKGRSIDSGRDRWPDNRNYNKRKLTAGPRAALLGNTAFNFNSGLRPQKALFLRGSGHFLETFASIGGPSSGYLILGLQEHFFLDQSCDGNFSDNPLVELPGASSPPPPPPLSLPPPPPPPPSARFVYVFLRWWKPDARNDEKGIYVLIRSCTDTTIFIMGRRAKHLSLAQQASASRESSLKGRIARAASRRPAQRRKVPPAPLGTLHDLPVLSTPIPKPTARMLELYDQALPHGAPLFEDALRSPDALDESDLTRWKEDPPFVEDDDTTDPYSPAYLAFTKLLAEVLHGVRLREQNTRDVELREVVRTKGREFVTRTLQPEICEMWTKWARAEKMLEFVQLKLNTQTGSHN
ncbi:hypothetical protein B0H13DRAFT_1865152 [Mycena leptocephala]|nr:hypothetical protein B0H13DRAFT_1865152 [Mycena leptocephala]